jgi:hypothetical protein
MTLKSALKVLLSSLLLFMYSASEGHIPLIDARPSGPVSLTDDLKSLKAEVLSYRTWTKVIPDPVLMDPASAFDCSAPGGRSGPHSNKYVLVYVNDIGRPAMMSDKHPRFPAGSIIVKAKLSDKTSHGTPELLTIMIKRAEGYDPANGNWDYLVAEGDVSRVERPSNVKSCQACHARHKGTDYVSRMYLPESVREKLR